MAIQAPLLSRLTVSAEHRFGASLQLIENFRYRIEHTIRNEQIVRAKWEIEWQTPEQSQKANAYIYELLGNKVRIISNGIILKELIFNQKFISGNLTTCKLPN